MNSTKIEYLDFTWNPIVGCTGENCEVRPHCWARKAALRTSATECPSCAGVDVVPMGSFIRPHEHPERLTQPLQRKKPTVIGVCFMGDLYDRLVKEGARQRVYHIIRLAQWHKFIELTKHPDHVEHAGDYLSDFDNLWLGVTVNSCKDIWRIRWLQQLHVKHRWVSFEPLYDDVTAVNGTINLKNIEGVVIGAQTHPDLQPDSRWVTNLIEQALKQNVKVFIKNNVHCGVPFESDKVNQLPWRT